MGKIRQQSINSRTEFFYYAFRNILLVSIPVLVVSGVVLSHLSIHSSANGVDTLTLTLSSSCTMSSVVDVEHSGTLTSGTYIENIGKTTITTLCNDGNGYSIYANGYSNNEEGNNKLINSTYPQYSIDTGLATSGLTSAWAMKLNNIPDDPSPTPPTIESDYNNVYGIVPPYWTKVAGRQSGTTDMDEGSSFTTTYAVYASSNQHAGSYVGQVKYLLTHPSTMPVYPIMQDIANWKNIRIPNIGDSIQAIDSRDGKKYWVTKLADGNIWMTQNLDLCIGCAGTAALTSENTDISTTSSGSGIYTDGYTVDSNNVWTWTPVSTAITSGRTITYPSSGNPTVSNWVNNNKTPYSAEGGDTYYYTSNSTSDDTRYDSLQACKNASHTEEECKRYFAGNYYNWSAAIASNNSTNIGSTVGDIASNSICPKGWRLPNASQTDNDNNEFGRILFKEGITASLSNGDESVGYYNGIASFNKLRSDPYYFVRSGYINGGTLDRSGGDGHYWSSTVSSSTDAYYLVFNDTGIYLARGRSRYYGRSVRCVAR